MTPFEVHAIFQQAEAKRLEADAARDAMAAVLLRAMRGLLPEGTVIELNRRPVPEYLLFVRTLSGNDRGTRKFRVVNVIAVEVDPTRPELSKWMCDAVPISEKTGKDMKGSTHSRASETVRLHGNVGHLGHEESIEASRDRLVNLVAANA